MLLTAPSARLPVLISLMSVHHDSGRAWLSSPILLESRGFSEKIEKHERMNADRSCVSKPQLSSLKKVSIAKVHVVGHQQGRGTVSPNDTCGLFPQHPWSPMLSIAWTSFLNMLIAFSFSSSPFFLLFFPFPSFSFFLTKTPLLYLQME